VPIDNYRLGPKRIGFKSFSLSLYKEYLNVVTCKISICFIPETERNFDRRKYGMLFYVVIYTEIINCELAIENH